MSIKGSSLSQWSSSFANKLPLLSKKYRRLRPNSWTMCWLADLLFLATAPVRLGATGTINMLRFSFFFSVFFSFLLTYLVERKADVIFQAIIFHADVFLGRHLYSQTRTSKPLNQISLIILHQKIKQRKITITPSLPKKRSNFSWKKEDWIGYKPPNRRENQI